MAAGVVADGGANVVRQDLQVGEHVVHGLVLPLGAGQCLVGVVHVGLVVLVVVEAHRLLVDMRLERGVVVRKRRDLIRH